MKKQLMIIGIIVLLVFVGLSGCQEKTSTESAENIMTNMVNALGNITSYSSSSSGVVIINNVKAGVTKGHIKLDITNKKLMSIQNVSMSMFGNTTTYIYVIDDVEYTNKTETSGYPELSKKNITQEMWNNYDISNQTMNLWMWNSSEITRLEDESVGGIECFVLKIIPTLEAYSQIISNATFGNYQLRSVEMKYWIDKSNYLPAKLFQQISMDTNSTIWGDMVYTTESYGLFSDYNSEFLIELPEWAVNASWA